MIFFLNSTNRVYNDTELNALSKILFTSGVFNTTQETRALWKLSGDFLVEPAGGNMNITALPGMATVSITVDGIEHQSVIQESAQLAATVAANLSLANRNDAVVLRVDQSIIDDDDLNAAGSNAVSLVVISGNSANALTDNEIAVALGGDPYVRLADILVPLSATEITSGMITDVRSMPVSTRAVNMGSDSFQFFSLSEDPEDLSTGMVWYNSTDGILKFYNGTNTIALQTQDFDWGYYPPDGVDQNVQDFDPTVENPGTVGVGALSAYQLLDVGDTPTNTTLMAGELFEMPNVANPFIRLKMGSPEYAAGLAIEVWSVDVNNDPDAQIEVPLTLGAGSIPRNDYISFYLDGELYTPGNKYLLVVRSNQIGFINGNDEDFTSVAVQISSYEDEDEILLGRMQGSVADLETDVSAVTWGDPATDSHFVMSIAEREEYAIGETDIAGNAYLASQGFVPKSQDITGFRVLRGADIGSPSGDITASLYLADENYQPTGDVLTSASLSAAEWATGGAGTEKVFALAYDELVVGSKYVVVLDTDEHDDANAYTLFFGTTTTGTAKINNTSDGWVDLNGNFFFAIITSTIRKIVVTNNQGLIPQALIPIVPKRVTYIESSATPAFSVDTADAVYITALAEAITNMSTNMIGTPTDFQELTFRITASGGAMGITWGDMFETAGVALDTSVADGKTLTAKFIYNAVSEKFGCVLSVETT